VEVDRTLPPGQRRIDGFPRFGTHFHRPPPAIPMEPSIEIGGAVSSPFNVPLRELDTLPRREIKADFHCVAGWSATGLNWTGVAVETFFREVIEPAVPAGTTVTHLVFRGLDGYQSVVEVGDALDADVLLADHLDGHPLDGDHGAPIRLVSPKQYGFVSTKHLCRIDAHTSEPRVRYHPSLRTELGLRLVRPHRRARVWEEERHRFLPAWAVRRIYRQVIAPIKAASGRRTNSA
jgi:DMSO/TMAO reductase YedYZ molybdopterin-dependent catalytic subunit